LIRILKRISFNNIDYMKKESSMRTLYSAKCGIGGFISSLTKHYEPLMKNM
jgi:hypothetical protein